MTSERDHSPSARVEPDGDVAGLRIGEVARRTGTTTALLRKWETRHGVLVPARTSGGQRMYSERDVVRVRLVQELVSQGWTIAGAVARLREGGEMPPDVTSAGVSPNAPSLAAVDVDDNEPLAEVPGPVPSATRLLAPLVDVDPEAVRVALDTTRSMMRATTPADVRDALVTMVARLGGTTGPAATQRGDVIPVDLSFGEGPPLLPRAAPATITRMRLESLLPALVEDARSLVHHLRLAHRGVNQPV
jgi:DNA-binding transcriptional MerR regulator